MNDNRSCLICKHRYCAKKVALFSGFSDVNLAKVLTLIQRKTYEKGEAIFHEGDLCDQLLIVNGGSMKVFQVSKEGKEQILYILSEGDFNGDLNLLKKDVYRLSGTALEETHLCIIGKDDFDRLLTNHPELYLQVMSYAHDRIKDLEILVQTLTTKDVESRLAVLLNRLAQSYGVQKDKGIEIQLTLTREEMANFVGLTRETVSRKLSSLQVDGLIELTDNHIILIKDMAALKRLAEI